MGCYLRYEIDAKGKDLPLQWDEIFEGFVSDAPIFLEIGFGRGDFLLYLSQKYKDAFIIGIETSLKCLERAQKLLYEKKVENVRLLKGDARFLVREVFPKSSLDAIFINFPCPWPKKKHAERRVTTKKFLKVYAFVLKVGGVFELYTDEKWYFEEVFFNLSQSSFFDVYFEENPLREVKTKYEKKWLKQGKTIYKIKAVRNNNIAKVERYCLEGGVRLHRLFKRKTDLSFDAVIKLKGLKQKDNDLVWTIKDVYYNPKDDVFLLECVTSDDGFLQKFYVKAVSYKGRMGEYIIKLDETSQPYRTKAVKFLFDSLAKILGDDLK